jgi:pyruvate kinase
MKGDLLKDLASEHRRNTRIIATIGPASRSIEKIRALIKANVNVFRLNFSHGSHEEHLEVLKIIRQVSEESSVYPAILQDLSGPKIRISPVVGDYAQIQDGSNITLRAAEQKNQNKLLSDSNNIFIEGLDPTKVLKPGQTALLADGIISINCTSVQADSVTCHVAKGGRLRSRVGIAFPDSIIDLPATTEKDMADLEWGIKNEVDYVAVSFVQNAADVQTVRNAINAKSSNVRIIAKIERKAALQNIYDIIDASDGIMVARGDLGLEFRLEELPMIQKRLIEEANYCGIPVIVATQMLHSMITAIRPTRAEVSDISAAVMSGADAVMLSEETAIGEHPIECVEYLNRITLEAEKSFAFEEYKLRLRDADHKTVPDAVSYAACAAAVKVNASAILACTETGYSARLVAKYRPQQPLFGISTQAATLRRMSLYWGVMQVLCKTSLDHHEEIENALRTVQEREHFPNGSRAVITGGAAVSQPGSTNIMEIRDMCYLK